MSFVLRTILIATASTTQKILHVLLPDAEFGIGRVRPRGGPRGVRPRSEEVTAVSRSH